MCASAGVRDREPAAAGDGGHRAVVHVRGGSPSAGYLECVGRGRHNVCIPAPHLHEILSGIN